MIFAIFLRLEDFIDWQKKPQIFKYQDEYQMTNFDSYHHLQFTKDLKLGNYDNIDEKRLVPNGAQRPKIPPLLPMLTLGISEITNIPIPTVAIFMPVFLSSLLVFVVFFLGSELGLNRTAALIVALLSIISITYVTRTRLGRFDTDSLNVVFTLLNSYLFLRFALYKKSSYLFLALGVINTLLYYLWWDNATSIVFLSAFVPFSIALLFFYESKKPLIKYFFLVILALIGFYFLNEQIIDYIKLAFNQKHDVFPLHNIIGELQAVDFSAFIKGTTGSVIIFIMALMGMIYFVKTQKIKTLFIIFPMILAFLPFIAGNRFMIFSAPILALGVGYFVQLLFDIKNRITIVGVYLCVVFIIVFAIYSNYGTITHKLSKPVVLERAALLNALKTHITVDANIWTNWILGDQIRYYLNQGSFADGRFKDGEIFYYLHFPLAANNLALSANFMRFYSQHGKQGMHRLYKILGSEALAFDFLRKVLSLKPKQAEKIIQTELQHKDSFKTSDLATTQQWLTFLYPQQDKDIYLFLHQKMLQKSNWFKQGNMDLKTGKLQGFPLLVSFYNLREKWDEISNKDIKINKQNGRGVHINGAQYPFSHILTYDGVQSKMTHYPKQSNELSTNYNPKYKDIRFVFEWDKELGYGAVMSQSVANTSFNKLFVRHKKSDYFQPILLKTPQYQIWKVLGDIYDFK